MRPFTGQTKSCAQPADAAFTARAAAILLFSWREQLMFAAELGEDKGKFAHLGQTQTQDHAQSQRFAKPPKQQDDNQAFDRNQAGQLR